MATSPSHGSMTSQTYTRLESQGSLHSSIAASLAFIFPKRHSLTTNGRSEKAERVAAIADQKNNPIEVKLDHAVLGYLHNQSAMLVSKQGTPHAPTSKWSCRGIIHRRRPARIPMYPIGNINPYDLLPHDLSNRLAIGSGRWPSTIDLPFVG
ncbi:hypothetical protein ASPBRDRAFT_27354 [Aspergillus brasiliensis CBS 101740]|uniref:Uncharacterized protein n=1 Tax=Aspergillus brasiliensis (strain CBS 101740 / IMI 381727 / IBT 21946) TaxID=767769 RepID=A0A1L9URE9_ASPBC|nr:hypothetical protein ASPBRDRAFT_27354 [Aspergillus brasiliensis CBS 101740]